MTDKEKLLRDYARMCNSINCTECGIGKEREREFCQKWIAKNIEKAAKIIEQWAAEHPVKTRQDLFLEQYPNAKVINNCGVIDVKPCTVDERLYNSEPCKEYAFCGQCKKDYWSQEVTE